METTLRPQNPSNAPPSSSMTPRSWDGPPTPRQPKIARRRAVKACLACRHRKVRCDVSILGPPCTNCHLDEKPCVVIDRATRRQLPIGSTKNTMEQVFDYRRPAMTGEIVCTDTPAEETNSDSQPEPCAAELPPSDPPSIDGDIKEADSLLVLQDDPISPIQDAVLATQPILQPMPTQELTAAINTPQSMPGPQLMLPREVGICSKSSWCSTWNVSFLDKSIVVNLLSPDINFLEAKGCFRIPRKPILDEFIREYFLHVHPFLPLLDEDHFWTAYRTSHDVVPKIPLLVFQAMLFASSAFVPLSVANALGYPNIQSARSSLYHNAKALFDTAADVPPIVAAQAALLLTFWCPLEHISGRANSVWLDIAIHHARRAKAHMAWNSTANLTDSCAQHDLHAIRMLKRLWWCCIIRDRFLSLGLKRRMQIPRPYPILVLSDFETEAEYSEVHGADTKARLVSILTQLMRLCNILTKLLPLLSIVDRGLGRQDEMHRILDECRVLLQNWHQTQSKSLSARKPTGLRQRSVIVHTNLMRMFYFSSRIALSHIEMLLNFPQVNDQCTTAAVPREAFRGQEVKDASLGTTDCLEELLQLDLARYLPLSAIAFSVTPLLLHVLDVTLEPPCSPPADQGGTQYRLNILAGAMQTYKAMYDGVDWLNDAVSRIAELARLDSASTEGLAAKSWADICHRRPVLYLRLALTIDFTVCETRIPDDREVSSILQADRVSNMQLPPALESETDSVLANAQERNPAPEANTDEGHIEQYLDHIGSESEEGLNDNPGPADGHERPNEIHDSTSLDFGLLGGIGLEDDILGAPLGASKDTSWYGLAWREAMSPGDALFPSTPWGMLERREFDEDFGFQTDDIDSFLASIV